jgi:hypothetical protein
MNFYQYTDERRRIGLIAGKGIKRSTQMQAFERRQPTACPRCGCQVFDPFGWNIVIHDVTNCTLEPPERVQ